MRNRRAALDGLSRILDSGAPEDLFTGPEEEAIFLYELLVDAARARRSAYYWEICRTARRRGVTPEYVIDRAVVLLGTINERQRTDLYRILDVPPLASGEMIRQRWLEIAKRAHPDTGGDGAQFHTVKEAYEILRDPARRADYERFWLRALGPFERVARRDDAPALGPTHPIVNRWTRQPESRSAGQAEGVAGEGRAVTPAAETTERPVAEAVERAAKAALDARLSPQLAGVDRVSGLFERVKAVLGLLPGDEIERLSADVARAIAELETIGEELRKLAALKASFPA